MLTGDGRSVVDHSAGQDGRGERAGTAAIDNRIRGVRWCSGSCAGFGVGGLSQAGPGDGEERMGDRADGDAPMSGSPFADLARVHPELIFIAFACVNASVAS